jgi:hypothetical protein
MRKQNELTALINRSVGSKAALLRAMKRTNTPIAYKTIYNWCSDARTIKIDQLINLAKVMNVPICDLIESITIKHEGDE